MEEISTVDQIKLSRLAASATPKAEVKTAQTPNELALTTDQQSPMELIARASRYMDNAKQQGRNRTVSR